MKVNNGFYLRPDRFKSTSRNCELVAIEGPGAPYDCGLNFPQWEKS